MYRKDSEKWISILDFLMLNLICLQLAYIFACWICGYGWVYSKMIYRNMAIFLCLIEVLLSLMTDSLNGIFHRGHYRNFVAAIEHAVVVGIVATLYLFALQQGEAFSRLTLGLTVVFFGLISFVVQELWKKFVRNKRAELSECKLMIVTTEDQADTVIQSIVANEFTRYAPTGIVLLDSDRVGMSIQGVPVVAAADQAAQYVCQHWVDEVLVVTKEGKAYPDELIRQLAETGVVVHVGLHNVVDIPGRRQFAENIAGYTVLTTSVNSASTKQLVMKRVMDIVLGISGCMATALIFLFVAPAIYIASPGPIFFAQERVGKNGKTFKMYKFRSMYMDAEERKAELMKDNKMGDAKMFKLDFDPRVIGNKILPDGTHKTGIGDFIRRTSLDEFPQFFNVLKGDMSIVGTRPPLVSETNLYELHHRVRLAIKPGITGMWQVSGRSDITDFEEVVRLDKEYISNWDIGTDLRILLKTVAVVLKKDGSM